MTEDYPALSYMCRGYVNQDWPGEYGHVWAAVDDFVEEEPDKAPQVPDEVAALLEREQTEDDLHRTMRSMFCGYWPYASGSTYKEWLTEVSRRVSERLSP